MTELVRKGSPKGIARLLARAPIWLYRAHLGGLLGGRFLLLNHVGRKSGLPRQTVLEVVKEDRSAGRYVIASGWGERSQWFQNLMKTPDVQIVVRRARRDVHAHRLDRDEAANTLFEYATAHPTAFANLGRFMIGERLAATREDACRLAEVVPLVALDPR